MPRHVLAALAVLAGSAVQTSAAPYMETAGHWTIVAVGSSCMAVNRPMAEFNASPWNGLALRVAGDGILKLQVHFWPGYAVTDADPVLQAAAAGKTIERLASATTVISDFAVETDQPLPDAFVERLRDGTELVLAAGGDSLTFDLTGVGDVLDKLEACRELI